MPLHLKGLTSVCVMSYRFLTWRQKDNHGENDSAYWATRVSGQRLADLLTYCLLVGFQCPWHLTKRHCRLDDDSQTSSHESCH